MRFFWNYTTLQIQETHGAPVWVSGGNGKDSRHGVALPLSRTERGSPQSSHPRRGTEGTQAGNQVPWAWQQSHRLGPARPGPSCREESQLLLRRVGQTNDTFTKNSGNDNKIQETQKMSEKFNHQKRDRASCE